MGGIIKTLNYGNIEFQGLCERWIYYNIVIVSALSNHLIYDLGVY